MTTTTTTATTLPTCTCGSKHRWEHGIDCELWDSDEFFMGELAWSADANTLVDASYDEPVPDSWIRTGQARKERDAQAKTDQILAEFDGEIDGVVSTDLPPIPTAGCSCDPQQDPCATCNAYRNELDGQWYLIDVDQVRADGEAWLDWADRWYTVRSLNERESILCDCYKAMQFYCLVCGAKKAVANNEWQLIDYEELQTRRDMFTEAYNLRSFAAAVSADRDHTTKTKATEPPAASTIDDEPKRWDTPPNPTAPCSVCKNADDIVLCTACGRRRDGEKKHQGTTTYTAGNRFIKAMKKHVDAFGPAYWVAPGDPNKTSYTYSSYSKCRHYGQEVVFPDGTRIIASSQHTRTVKQAEEDVERNAWPSFGIYMASSWSPRWLSFYINWTDHGLPLIPDSDVIWACEKALAWAREGEVIEIGCIGGHGRTGALMACMATMCGVPATEAAQWVWDNYCTEAIESASQEWYIIHFDEVRRGVPEAEQTPMPKPKPVASTGYKPTGTGASSSYCTEIGHFRLWVQAKTCEQAKSTTGCWWWPKDVEKFERGKEAWPQGAAEVLADLLDADDSTKTTTATTDEWGDPETIGMALAWGVFPGFH